MLARQLKNSAYFTGGLAVLALVATKHKLRGYATPTGFPSSDWERSAANVIAIVEDYRRNAEIGGRRFAFNGARVLELGPGLTLGTGVLLAGLDIKSYHAIDAFPLAQSTAPGFYTALAEGPLPDGLDRSKVAAAAKSVIEGDAGLISYAHDAGFDIGKLVENRQFDLIVSNAAFEHFDDVDDTIAALSDCAAPGALFMAMIDFQTHSRFVREVDPNSIYRLPAGLYRALHFPGQPNRWRPGDYAQSLTKRGWVNISVRSVDTVSPDYAAWANEGLAAEFQPDSCDMHILTGVIAAERPR
jgi:Methyltransferase domain